TPRWVVAAPGRVNIIGEHTDYSGGLVLPMAIDRYTVIAAAPAPADAGLRLRVHSAAVDETVDIPLAATPVPGEPRWANYARGVVAGFGARGLIVPALDALVISDVPLGGGLSSSASFEVATATLLEAALGKPLGPTEKARLCRQAEHDYAQVPCGIMDQLISVLGDEAGALLIDCRTQQTKLVPFADPSVTLLIANSNVRHSLGDGAYAVRMSACVEAARMLDVAELSLATPAMVAAAENALGPLLYRRARHVVTENARTRATAEALAGGDWNTAGALMYESHRSLRDDYEVSSPELDTLVELARDIGVAGGVYGARMTGGGFGGCTVTLAASDRIADIGDRLAREYQRRHNRPLTWFVSRPARGAHVVEATSA
ncbi:MAG TPA: galactokinase, partial [Polyangia bacterium]|nr:galactokinase [Polyangia bacterium]